jgi:hypothetical protein
LVRPLLDRNDYVPFADYQAYIDEQDRAAARSGNAAQTFWKSWPINIQLQRRFNLAGIA